MSGDLGVWLAGICTIAIYSSLYGDNPLFRSAEHLFVGFAAAHMAVMGYESIVSRAWGPMLAGEFWWLGAMAGGVALLARLIPSPSIRWVSRIPLGFMMGVAAGLTANRAIEAEFWRQIRATIELRWDSADNILFVALVVASLSYFLFIYDDKTLYGRGLKGIAEAGKIGMMIAFGASLGATVMARLSLVIHRLEFLLGTWLGILPH